MVRKERPTRVYRMETTDLRPGSKFLNTTTQFLNQPDWWPGPSEETRERDGKPIERTLYLEGRIEWETEE